MYARGKAVIADSAFDSNDIIADVKSRGMKAVISLQPRRKYNRVRPDKRLYALRYRIECMFHSLKRFRAIASRYEKTATNFLAVVHIGCAILWLN
jgi:transposase